MKSTIGFLGLLVAAILFVVIVLTGSGDAQATCERSMSADVCFMTLNP